MVFSRSRWIALLIAAVACVAPASVQAFDQKMLPSGTELALTVNFNQILKSEIAQSDLVKPYIDQAKEFLQKEVEKDAIADKYTKIAGIDLFRDLGAVTMVANGTKDAEKSLIIVEGNFNPGKIQTAAEEAAKDQALVISKVGDAVVYEITPKEKTEGAQTPAENAVQKSIAGKTIYVSVLDKSTVIASASKETLGDTLARSKGAMVAKLSPTFKTLLDNANSKQSFSFVATGAALSSAANSAGPGVPNAGDAAKSLNEIDGMFVSLTVKDSVHFQMGIAAKTEVMAKQLSDQGGQYVALARAMAQMQADQNKKFAPLVAIANTIRLSSEGRNITIEGTATLEAITELAKMAPMTTPDPKTP